MSDCKNCHNIFDWSECSDCSECETHYNKSRNKKTIHEIEYVLCSDRLMITDNVFTELLYFPWLDDKGDVLRTGTITVGVQIDNTVWMQVQVFDSTTSTIMGRSQVIKESGVHNFNFRIPQNDAQLTIMFKKFVGIGDDPQIRGVTLNYKYKN